MNPLDLLVLSLISAISLAVGCVSIVLGYLVFKQPSRPKQWGWLYLLWLRSTGSPWSREMRTVDPLDLNHRQIRKHAVNTFVMGIAFMSLGIYGILEALGYV